MKKQVSREHYRFRNYMNISRWDSLWHQLDIVMALDAETILEVGPGPGIFKAIGAHMGLHVETADLDPDLEPDHVASVIDLPLADASFDVTCAFQVLEHMPFEVALLALDELARVARRHVVISLPDARRTWRYLAHLPRLGERGFFLPRPQLSAPPHHFDGEHYWEINKRGHELKRVILAFLASRKLDLVRTFRPFENPYHRFFVFSVAAQAEVRATDE
jgi:hypothetical protein